jgi:hypothetical protein
MKKLYPIAGLVFLATQAYGANGPEREYLRELNNAIDNQNVTQVEELASIMCVTSEQKRAASEAAQKWVELYEKRAMQSFQTGNDVAKAHGGPLLALLSGLGAGAGALALKYEDKGDAYSPKTRNAIKVGTGTLAGLAVLGIGLTAGSAKCPCASTIAKWISGPAITALGLVGTVGGLFLGASYAKDGDAYLSKLWNVVAGGSVGLTALGAWLTTSVWGKSHAHANLLRARRISAAVKDIPVSDKDSKKFVLYRNEGLQA